MGCSRLGYCQPRPRECQEDGYLCQQASDCCSGQCNGGTCMACGEYSAGATCNQATGCCFFFDSACDSTNQCSYAYLQADNGFHCASAEFCTSGFCNLSDAGPPPEGICQTAPPGCTLMGAAPAVGGCCLGLVKGDAGANCCLPDKSYCYYDSSCCSGTCSGGRCLPLGGRSGRAGDRCLTGNDCTGAALCDPVSRTCQTRWCFPGTVPHSGCCNFSWYSGLCNFADGGVCGIGGPNYTCSVGADCCSGACNGTTHECSYVQFF